MPLKMLNIFFFNLDIAWIKKPKAFEQENTIKIH